MRRLIGWMLFLMLCIVCPFSLAEEREDADWRDALNENELALYAFIDGSTATIPLSEAVAMHRLGITKAQASQLICHNTTPIAYQSLIYGASHRFDNVAKLIFVTAPSQYELEDAREEEVELELIPVAHDALVFLNNVQNPVKGLSSRQLLDIYTGKITSWKEVGGEDASIIPFQRTWRSGSQTLFMDLLMREEKPMDAPAAYRPDSMGFLIEEVSNYENGKSSLGYSVYYYVHDMYGSEQVRMLTIGRSAISSSRIFPSTRAAIQRRKKKSTKPCGKCSMSF